MSAGVHDVGVGARGARAGIRLDVRDCDRIVRRVGPARGEAHRARPARAARPRRGASRSAGVWHAERRAPGRSALRVSPTSSRACARCAQLQEARAERLRWLAWVSPVQGRQTARRSCPPCAARRRERSSSRSACMHSGTLLSWTSPRRWSQLSTPRAARIGLMSCQVFISLRGALVRATVPVDGGHLWL